jgi:transcriptional regulator with XRE-family HTH domain
VSMLAVVLANLKVSQGELARRSGLTRQTISDAYHGRGGVSLSSWVKIAKALHVPLSRVSPLAASELDGVVVSG